jgi:hypothetical protein
MYSVHPAHLGQCVAALALTDARPDGRYLLRASMINLATAISQ